MIQNYYDEYMDEKHQLIMLEYQPSFLQLALAGYLMANIQGLDMDDALLIGSDNFRAVMKVFLKEQKALFMKGRTYRTAKIMAYKNNKMLKKLLGKSQ